MRRPKITVFPHALKLLHEEKSDTITVVTLLKGTQLQIKLLDKVFIQQGLKKRQYLLTSENSLTKENKHLEDISDLKVIDESFFVIGAGLNTHPESFQALNVLERLMTLAISESKTLVFFPLLFLWHRKPDRTSSNKQFKYLRYARRLVLSIGEPIEWSSAKAEDISPSDTASLRRVILREFYRERRIITGDPARSRRKIIATLMKDEELQKSILSSAKTGNVKVLKRKATHYLKEISADYRDLAPRLWMPFVKYFFTHQFNGIEINKGDMARLRHLLRIKRKCVLVPTHRSHIDYVIFSYMCYMNGLIPPLVAAGQNLTFWPMGWIFRHTGAFFIRRTFRGLDIYPTVFKTYLKYLLKYTQPIEVFIEGGRSRTGRYLQPKLGFLSMLLDALHFGVVDELTFIPVAINYDRIIEEDAYIRELSGKPKEKERVQNLLKSWHLLKRKHGYIYISISDPITVKQSETEKVAKPEFKEQIGYDIMYRALTSTTVTTVSVFSLAFLSNAKTQQEYTELKKRFDFLVHYFKSDHCITASNLEEPDAFDSVLQFLEDQELCIRNNSSAGKHPSMISINPQKMLIFEYSKNSILGYLFIEAAKRIASIENQFDSDVYKEIIKNICPWFFPVKPESIFNTPTTGECSVLESYQNQLITSAITPILAAYIIACKGLLERSENRFISQESVKKSIRKSITSIFYYSVFPQCVTEDLIKNIQTGLFRNDVLCRDKDRGQVMVKDLPELWHRLDRYLTVIDPRLTEIQPIHS
ncbi:glycerol-3-phosphate acyltransferase [bacterium]|nr:glycerol-3-phosphate acyltransferase [candidate division CSSED10-310 bacterium]